MKCWQRLGAIALAIVLVWCARPAFAQADATAREVFRDAYEQRYTWGELFPGFVAEVSVVHEGQAEGGIVRIRPDYTVETANFKFPEVEDFVRAQMQFEATHHRTVPFEQVHGGDRFEFFDTGDPDTVGIREFGDDSESSYLLADGAITQVNRTLGSYAVTVDTIGLKRTPRGYMSVQFVTEFRDAETDEVLERDDVRSYYQLTGRYYFLSSRELRYGGPDDDPTEHPVPESSMIVNDFQRLELLE